MAICLMRALIGSNENLNPNDTKQIDYDQISKYYKDWYKSDPFHVSKTADSSMEMLSRPNNSAKHALMIAISHNHMSLNSSSLMKITPLAVWACKLEQT